ncbi:hypothetical protein Cgig2_029307 [Carnegiea gigantea]|uniref:Transmembrane protein n=1 Tax=Carnegiea gigantea TaxID=171969 RepID=A0A9Q1KU68_9CARY|nr:hypothetical protein Cgig2_029307 [Carnegiea gigantea]
MSEKENKGVTGAAASSAEQTPSFHLQQQYYGTFQGIPSYNQPPPQPVVGFPQPAPPPGTAPACYYAHGYQTIPEMEVTEMGLPSIVTDLKVLEVAEIGLPSAMRDLRSIVDRKCGKISKSQIFEMGSDRDLWPVQVLASICCCRRKTFEGATTSLLWYWNWLVIVSFTSSLVSFVAAADMLYHPDLRIRFIAGFFLAAIPWYVGALILLCVRVDYREKPGLVACMVASILAVIAVVFGVTKGTDSW